MIETVFQNHPIYQNYHDSIILKLIGSLPYCFLSPLCKVFNTKNIFFKIFWLKPSSIKHLYNSVFLYRHFLIRCSLSVSLVVFSKEFCLIFSLLVVAAVLGIAVVDFLTPVCPLQYSPFAP